MANIPLVENTAPETRLSGALRAAARTLSWGDIAGARNLGPYNMLVLWVLSILAVATGGDPTINWQ